MRFVILSLLLWFMAACSHDEPNPHTPEPHTPFAVRFVLAGEPFEGTAEVDVLQADSVRGTLTLRAPAEVDGTFEGMMNASELVVRLRYVNAAGCSGSGEMRGDGTQDGDGYEGTAELMDSCDGSLKGTFEMTRVEGRETGPRDAGVEFVPGAVEFDSGSVRGVDARRAAAFLDRMAEYGFSGTVLVARGEALLLSRAYGHGDASSGDPNRIESVYPLASVTKQFTAAAVLALVETGRLSLENPLSRFFPDVPEDKSAITVHQLLTHTSGLGASGLPLFDTAAVHTRESVRIGIFESPMAAPVGTRFDYENENYVLLAMIIEHVTGENFVQHLERTLFSPLDEEQIAFLPVAETLGWTVSAGHTGTFADVREERLPYAVGQMGAAGVVASASGVRAWMNHLVAGRVVSAETLQRMWGRHTETGFGYGWRVGPGGAGEIRYTTAGDLGGIQTQVDWYPADSLLVIVLGNTRVEGMAWRDHVALGVSASIRSAPVSHPPAIADPPWDSDSYVGTYRDGPEGVRVWRHGPVLRATASGQRAIDLLSGRDRLEPLTLELNGRIDGLVARLISTESPDELPFLSASASARLRRTWSVLTEVNGPARFHLVHGSVPNGPVRWTTFVAIDFESTTVTLRFLWDESHERITGWATDREWPVERVLFPVGPAEWTAFQPGSPPVGVSFLAPTRGEVTGLRLGDENAELRRVR